MPTLSKLNPSFKIGDIVVLNSYPGKQVTEEGAKWISITGDPLHVPPIMIVTGIEIEDKKKRTHHEVSGDQIAERIKYHVTWFDSKKSEFVNKVLYQSFMKKEFASLISSRRLKKINYKFGGACDFLTTYFELKKRKTSISEIYSTYHNTIGEESQNNKTQEKTDFLLSYVCPSLVMTGTRVNSEPKSFYPNGDLRTQNTEKYISVTWFNFQQQKYSVAELPIECLITKN